MNYIKIVITIILISVSISLFPSDRSMLYIDRSHLNEISDFSFLPATISPKMLHQLPDTLHSKSVGNYNVFELKNQTYAIGDGFFDVLQWNDTAWTNLYTSPFFGYNFGRKIFIYKGEIYAIGGYGYWHAHSNLIKFDPELGYWTMIVTVNKPDNYYSECISKIGDTIISSFGKFVDESINLSKVAKDAYMLNLDKMDWYELDLEIPSLYDKNIYFHCFYDLADYSIIELSLTTEHGYYVLDKSTLEVFFYKRDAIDLLESPFVFVNDNSITYANNNADLITLDFSSIDYYANPVGKLIGNTIFFSKIFWFMVLAIIIMAIFIVFIKQKHAKVKKVIGKRNEFDSNVKEITNNILQHKGDEVSLEEINKLIGISDLGYEVRRQKRSKLIKEINLEYKVLYGKELITRIRNSKDKRHFIYKINNNE